MMRYIFHIALSCLALTGAASSAFGNKWDQVQQSTVYIFFDAADPATGAKTAMQGTGFVVSRLGYILTSSQLLRDWSKQSQPEKEENPIRASLGGKPGDIPASPLNLTVIDPGNPDSGDAALLKMPAPGRDLVQGYTPAPVCLASPQEPAMGDAIVAFGFPSGQNIQPVPGILGTKDVEGGRWAATAAFAEGMSGGPVYDSSGNLLGMVSGGSAETEAAQWITPIRHRENLLRIAGVSQECPGIAYLGPSNVTIMNKSVPATLHRSLPARQGFKTVVELLTLEPVLLRIVDGNSGDPIAHAFIRIINQETGNKLEQGETNENGEFAFKSYYESLRIRIRDRSHQDLLAKLRLSNRDRLRVVIPMTNRCLAKK